MESKGQLSPDGQWFWDGAKWISTLSPDRASKWDGHTWVSSGKAGPAAVAFAPLTGRPRVGRWKLAVVGLVGLMFLGFVGNAIAQQPPSNSTAQLGAAPPTASGSAPHSPASTPIHPPSPSPNPTLAPPPPPPPPPTAAATSAPAPPDPYAAAKAAGASAVCADGTWSYSKTRSGTCSGHGGVHWWTGNLGPAGPGGH
jgi:hypothetical protein